MEIHSRHGSGVTPAPPVPSPPAPSPCPVAEVYSPTYDELISLIQDTLIGLIPYPEPCPQSCTNTDAVNKLYYTATGYLENIRQIMTMWGFSLDGTVRETVRYAGIENYSEKYVRTVGNAKDGLYCYNFCLDTDPFRYQPTGAMNLE